MHNQPQNEVRQPPEHWHDALGSIESGGERGIRTRHRSQLGWGLLGFLIGAVFWHFVGFWGFVRDVVYNVRPSEEHFVEQTGRDCVALQLHRTTGAVSSLPCPSHAPLLNEGVLASRQDFAIRAASQQTHRIKDAMRLTSGD